MPDPLECLDIDPDTCPTLSDTPRCPPSSHSARDQLSSPVRAENRTLKTVRPSLLSAAAGRQGFRLLSAAEGRSRRPPLTSLRLHALRPTAACHTLSDTSACQLSHLSDTRALLLSPLYRSTLCGRRPPGSGSFLPQWYAHQRLFFTRRVIGASGGISQKRA